MALDAPAGYYSDPTDPSHQRCWDGAGWTNHVRPSGSDLPPPPPAGASLHLDKAPQRGTPLHERGATTRRRVTRSMWATTFAATLSLVTSAVLQADGITVDQAYYDLEYQLSGVASAAMTVSTFADIVALVLFAVAGVTYLRWQHAAVGDDLQVTTSPAASVVHWFVPVANLLLVPQLHSSLAPDRRRDVWRWWSALVVAGGFQVIWNQSSSHLLDIALMAGFLAAVQVAGRSCVTLVDTITAAHTDVQP